MSYFGNCLINLDDYNGQASNWYRVTPVDDESFWNTTDGEYLSKNATFWLVRGTEIPLSHTKEDYSKAGIDLAEYETDQIRVEGTARLVVPKHKDVFMGTDQELYRSIPNDLKKILVLEEWYHRDFNRLMQPQTTDEHLQYIYELNRGLIGNKEYMDFESFVTLFRQSENRNEENNQNQLHDGRPGSYETWQQLARVIVSGNTAYYKPTFEPNSHWRYWPESGSL